MLKLLLPIIVAMIVLAVPAKASANDTCSQWRQNIIQARNQANEADVWLKENKGVEFRESNKKAVHSLDMAEKYGSMKLCAPTPQEQMDYYTIRFHTDYQAINDRPVSEVVTSADETLNRYTQYSASPQYKHLANVVGLIHTFVANNACAVPNAGATIINPLVPETPADALKKGITGTVEMLVDLDASSHVQNITAVSGPDILRASAIYAAKKSTFKTEVKNCQSIPSQYKYIVEFTTS